MNKTNAIDRVILCPRCKSKEFWYIEYHDGRRAIISPCFWELVELSTPADDMEPIEYDAT